MTNLDYNIVYVGEKPFADTSLIPSEKYKSQMEFFKPSTKNYAYFIVRNSTYINLYFRMQFRNYYDGTLICEIDEFYVDSEKDINKLSQKALKSYQ